MSKAGMLGLLEGFGDGVKMVGDGMVKNALLEAQEKRQMNLLNIQRQWGKEDKLEDRAYQAGVKADDQAYAQKEAQIAEAKASTIRDEERADKWDALKFSADEKKADQKTAFENQMKVAQFGIDNREPSDTDKKQKELKSMLDSGEITKEEYKNHILGLSKTAGFTQKDLADAWEGAYKQAAKERESDMKFQGLPAEEQNKALDSRAGELMQRFVGSSGSGANAGNGKQDPIAESVINEDAKKYAILPAEKQYAAVKRFIRTGYSDDDIKILLEKSEEYSKKNQDQAVVKEQEINLQQARQRVAMAQAAGQQPNPEDLALITPPEEKTLTPADRIRQVRRQSWEQQNKGKQIPDDMLNRGLLQ